MLLFFNHWVYSCFTFNRLCKLLSWYVLLVCCGANAEVLQVSISNPQNLNSSDPRYYFEKLLFLALTKTSETDGPFVIRHNYHGNGTERDRAMLIAGIGIDVMWGTVTSERRDTVRVVSANILKDLNNYHILLINSHDQASFDKINSLDELRKLTVGSGLHWTDTKILKANGFNVITTPNYLGLYKMLEARRVDFISRGLHEIGYDFLNFAKDGLVIENNLILKYDMLAKYSFFVKKDNIKLASRIERGLKLAESDGSYDALFNSMSSFKRGMDILASPHRIVIELTNKIDQ
ncbi:MAG: hypothetical protein V4732_09665 [Pseudomonadota bacterium]